jgi:hypothetical protein
MPVQGERGVGISAARPMKPALLAQYISGAHVKTVTGGRVLLVARGLPDRGPGLEAARRACQHLANDVIRFNILVVPLRILHNTRDLKGDFKASHETVALFLEAGAGNNIAYADVHRRVNVCKGKATSIIFEGWYMELMADVEDCIGKGISGHITKAQNIVEYTGIGVYSQEEVIDALALDPSAKDIIGLYWKANGAGITLMLKLDAQLDSHALRVAIGGDNWKERRLSLPECMTSKVFGIMGYNAARTLDYTPVRTLKPPSTNPWLAVGKGGKAAVGSEYLFTPLYTGSADSATAASTSSLSHTDTGHTTVPPKSGSSSDRLDNMERMLQTVVSRLPPLQGGNTGTHPGNV